MLDEVLFPLSTPLTDAQVYVEIGDGISTAVALTNATGKPALVNFAIRASNGSLLRSGELKIPARGQVSHYLTDEPFLAPSMIGTLVFNSTAPISAIAVRIAENKFFEPSFSRIQVTDLSVKQNPRLLLPFFKTGEEWRSVVVLVNPTHDTLEGRLQQVFYNDNLVHDEPPGSFDYAIPPQGVIRLSLPDSPSLKRGYIRLNPADGDLAPTASVLLRLEDSGVPVVLATMEAVEMREVQDLYIQQTEDSVTTRVAIINPSNRAATATLDLRDPSDVSLGPPKVLRLMPGEMRLASLDELRGESLKSERFEGVLRIQGEPDSQIVSFGLRDYHGRGDRAVLSIVPPLQELAAQHGPAVFPNFVDGRGFASQIVLFNDSGMASALDVRFFSTSGEPMPLPMRELKLQSFTHNQDSDRPLKQVGWAVAEPPISPRTPRRAFLRIHQPPVAR